MSGARRTRPPDHAPAIEPRAASAERSAADRGSPVGGSRLLENLVGGAPDGPTVRPLREAALLHLQGSQGNAFVGRLVARLVRSRDGPPVGAVAGPTASGYPATAGADQPAPATYERRLARFPRLGGPRPFHPWDALERLSDVTLLAWLRSIDPGSKAKDAKLTASLKDSLQDDPATLWLALTIQQHGPEPLWPHEALLERRRLAKALGPVDVPGGVQGSLGASPDKRPVTAYFFPGTGNGRALVVGGVHGSEQSGIEVAHLLVESLQKGPPPFFTVIVVPVLFPDNLAAARAGSGGDSRTGRNTKGNLVDPNRNFPAPGEGLETARSKGGKKGPVDEMGQPIEPGNVMLLDLIDRFKPDRVASVHAHSHPEFFRELDKMKPEERRKKLGKLTAAEAKKVQAIDAAGIFADAHTVAPLPKDASPGDRKKYADAVTEAATRSGADDALALAMARHAAKHGARLPGNWLDSGTPTLPPTALYPPGAPKSSKGTSLGGWGPRAVDEPGTEHDRPSMTVLTVEVQHYHPSGDMASEAGKAARLKELAAHRDALREIFLGPPAAAGPDAAGKE